MHATAEVEQIMTRDRIALTDYSGTSPNEDFDRSLARAIAQPDQGGGTLAEFLRLLGLNHAAFEAGRFRCSGN